MLPYNKFPKIKSAFCMVQDIHFYNEIIEIVLSEKSLQRSTRVLFYMKLSSNSIYKCLTMA
jgi:hypothetical protein